MACEKGAPVYFIGSGERGPRPTFEQPVIAGKPAGTKRGAKYRTAREVDALAQEDRREAKAGNPYAQPLFSVFASVVGGSRDIGSAISDIGSAIRRPAALIGMRTASASA
jgi:hypothetical protein